MTADMDLQSSFNIGPFTVLPERNLLTRKDQQTHLEPKQMKALVALAKHQPDVVSKQMLIDEVWDGRDTSDESITGCIKGLRAALDNDSPRKPKYVETIHGSGYRLIVPVEQPRSASRKAPIPRTWLSGLAVATILLVGAAFFLLSPESPPPSQQIDSVVITRFVNASSAASQPTVDGITEQVVSTLYEVPNLTIKKGNLPSDDETAMEIADRYGVGWVVFGSVLQMNGQIKISARIDDRDSVVEWAGTFIGTDKEAFELHEQVATAIRDKIRGAEKSAVNAPSQPASPEAYDNYLLGQFYLAKRDRASLDTAIEYFSGAIELDRNYGPAYLDLANTYLLLADYGTREEMFSRAIATVAEGVTRDAAIRNASQTVSGYVMAKRGDWQAAADAFAVATSDTAQYPVAHHYHSIMLAAVGRTDASLQAALRAWEMEPDTQVLNSRLAIAYFWQGDIDNARRYYAIANTLGPGAPIYQLSYALFLVRDGRIDEAREFVRSAIQLLNADPSWIDPIFDQLNGPLPSATLNSLLAQFSAQRAIPANVLITLWALAEQPDRVMDTAWQLIDEPGLIDIELIYLDEFRGLRQHEKFRQLADELGLQDYWDHNGCQWEGDRLNCRQD